MEQPDKLKKQKDYFQLATSRFFLHIDEHLMNIKDFVHPQGQKF